MKSAIYLAAMSAMVFFLCVSWGAADHSSRENLRSAAGVEPVKSSSSVSLVSENANDPSRSRSDAVQLQSGVEREPSANVGDINLNGVPNEVADAVLYSKYFIYGLKVFSIDQQSQISQTDINGDGLPLSVSDLVYQINMIDKGK